MTPADCRQEMGGATTITALIGNGRVARRDGPAIDVAAVDKPATARSFDRLDTWRTGCFAVAGRILE